MVNEVNILQFGVGKFIRGYFDWLLSKLNLPINICGIYFSPKKHYSELKANACVFNVILKGQTHTQIDTVTTLKDIFYAQDINSVILEKDFDIIVSNTTEKGLLNNNIKETYAYKLTAVLFEKYKLNPNAAKKIIILPLELVKKNGQFLKQQILDIAQNYYHSNFKDWVLNTCEFVNTLVDCIVTNQYNLDIEREDYYAFYLSNNSYLQSLFSKSNLNVFFTSDLEKIGEIKIKILNGIHTFLVCSAFLDGKKTVFEAISDKKYSLMIDELFFNEIMPTIKYDKDFVESFYTSTIQRLKNPNITHYLSDIALNTYEKFYERLGKTIVDYQILFNKKPRLLMQAFYNLKKLYPYKKNLNDFNDYIAEFQY